MESGEMQSSPAVWAVVLDFNELVKNAIDAKATRLQIDSYNDEQGNFIVEIKDDGQGLSKNFMDGNIEVDYAKKLGLRHKICSQKISGFLGGKGYGLALKQMFLAQYEGGLFLDNHAEKITEDVSKSGGARLRFKAPKDSLITQRQASENLQTCNQNCLERLRLGAAHESEELRLDLSENRLWKRRRLNPPEEVDENNETSSNSRLLASK